MKTKKQKLGPNQLRWIAALRSGRYEQGKEWLRTVDNRHCCLGVACRVLKEPGQISKTGKLWEYDGCNASAPTEVKSMLSLNSALGRITGGFSIAGKDCLAFANDAGATFAEIADFIEAHPEAVFTEAK